MGLAAALAAAIGYATGTLVHWLVSSRFVFPDRLADAGLQRGGQQILFIASAVLGIALTSAIVSWGVEAGVHVLLAKAAAMIVSFMAVFLVRLTIVFRLRE
jgi:putative flippase GtrA